MQLIAAYVLIHAPTQAVTKTCAGYHQQGQHKKIHALPARSTMYSLQQRLHMALLSAAQANKSNDTIHTPLSARSTKCSFERQMYMAAPSLA
eukprot:1161539-Pelagomonas_calceolata.AAC.11